MAAQIMMKMCEKGGVGVVDRLCRLTADDDVANQALTSGHWINVDEDRKPPPQDLDVTPIPLAALCN